MERLAPAFWSVVISQERLKGGRHPPKTSFRNRKKSFAMRIFNVLRFTSAKAFSPWEPKRLAISSLCQVEHYNLLAKGVGFSS